MYRLWSTIVAAYLTVDLTYEQLLVELQMEAIREALLNMNANLKNRMKRAHTSGTSDAYGSEVNISGPWHPERGEDGDEDGDEDE